MVTAGLPETPQSSSVPRDLSSSSNRMHLGKSRLTSPPVFAHFDLLSSDFVTCFEQVAAVNSSTGLFALWRLPQGHLNRLSSGTKWLRRKCWTASGHVSGGTCIHMGNILARTPGPHSPADHNWFKTQDMVFLLVV